MAITATSLLTAIDQKRADTEESYRDVANSIGFHSALFTRLRGGDLPSRSNVDALVDWLGDEYTAECDTCQSLDKDDTIDPEQEADESKVYAIWATGHLSESEDPATQAAVTRARELITEGAVGVSVMLDLHPDDTATLAAAPVNEEGAPVLPDGFTPRQRIRHTAIVGTPALPDAKLSIRDDGALEGIVTFEGIWTGDVRFPAEPNTIDLDGSNVPSPILYNRDQEGHEGPTIGYITGFERREVTGPVAGRPLLNDEAITASLAALDMPAAYFAQIVPTGPDPIRISKPDAKGYRAIRGLAAAKGVCHRSNMACFQYNGDPDAQLRHFHTGSLLRLDNGNDIRVGAVTIGGHHLDPALAKLGVRIDQTDNYRDNANTVLALVRAWPTKFGLMIAGVIPPDVTESQVMRALACAPSVELWPRKEDGRRTLMGIHFVPRPAIPVMASVGVDGVVALTTEPITLDDTVDDDVPDEPDAPEGDDLAAINAKLDNLTTVCESILNLIPLPEIPDE